MLRPILPETVPARPVVIFRVVFGIAATIKALELAARTLFHPALPRPLYSVVPVLPLTFWCVVALVMTASSVLIAVGRGTRTASLVTGLLVLAFMIGFQSNNHTYLMATLALMLSLVDFRHTGSPGAREARVWALPVFLIRAQISLVYIYAALGKINLDFLSGNVLASLGFRSMLVSGEFRWMPLLVAMSAGTLIVEMFIGVGLWLRRVRPFAFVAGVLLHVCMISYISETLIVALNLGLFAAMMIAGYVLFLDPDTSPSAPEPEASPSEPAGERATGGSSR